MANSACSYHEAKPTLWRCLDCRRNFCDDCVVLITSAGQKPMRPECSLCSAPLTAVDDGPSAAPFWPHARRLLAYPCNRTGLALLALSGAAALLLHLGLAGVAALLLAAFATLGYGLMAMRRVAAGYSQVPPIRAVFSDPLDPVLQRSVIVLTALAAVTAGLQLSLGRNSALSFLTINALLAPAVFVNLRVEPNLSRALNPLKLLSTVMLMGSAYPLLALLGLALVLGPTLASGLWSEPSAALTTAALTTAALLAAAWAYCSIAFFALLGQALRENKDTLGYLTRNLAERSVADTPANRCRAISGAATVLIREGRIEDGLAQLFNAPTEIAGRADLFEPSLDCLIELQQPAALREAAGQLIGYHLTNNSPELALATWRRVVQAQPGFVPEQHHWRHALATIAYEQGAYAQSQALLQDSDSAVQETGDLVAAYQLMIRISKGYSDSAQTGKLALFVANLNPEQRVPDTLAQRPAANQAS